MTVGGLSISQHISKQMSAAVSMKTAFRASVIMKWDHRARTSVGKIDQRLSSYKYLGVFIDRAGSGRVACPLITGLAV